MVNIFNYVHTNPVELWEKGWKSEGVANGKEAIKKLENYYWSSYRDYIDISTFPSVIQKDFFLELFGSGAGCKESVEDWILHKAFDKGFDKNNPPL